MNWWTRRRARKRREQADHAYQLALETWQGHRDQVRGLLDLATHLDKLHAESDDLEVSLRLHRGETILLVAQGAELVEPRSTGHYEGGSRGVSIRVMRGVSYRVGAHRGTFVRGPDQLTVIDRSGTFYVTDQRCVYSSDTHTREWDWDKLVDIHHEGDATYLSVSNRQKTSGVVYGTTAGTTVQDRITLALAIHDGELEHLIGDLREELHELQGSRPQPPATPL